MSPKSKIPPQGNQDVKGEGSDQGALEKVRELLTDEPGRVFVSKVVGTPLDPNPFFAPVTDYLTHPVPEAILGPEAYYPALTCRQDEATHQRIQQRLTTTARELILERGMSWDTSGSALLLRQFIERISKL